MSNRISTSSNNTSNNNGKTRTPNELNIIVGKHYKRLGEQENWLKEHENRLEYLEKVSRENGVELNNRVDDLTTILKNLIGSINMVTNENTEIKKQNDALKVTNQSLQQQIIGLTIFVQTIQEKCVKADNNSKQLLDHVLQISSLVIKPQLFD